MLWNQTMVNSILNEMRSVLRWFNHPSWSYGDNLVTLGGLLHKLIIGLGTFESVAEDPSDSSVLALVSTSMSSPICLLGPCLRNFALRIKVVPVYTLTKLKVSLALVSLIYVLGRREIWILIFRLRVGTKYEIANFEMMGLCMRVAYYRDIPSNALDTNCILTDVRDRVLIVLIWIELDVR